MSQFKKLFTTFSSDSLIKIQNNAVSFTDLNIPYPTRALVFHTNENPENRVGGFGIKISINLEDLEFDTSEPPLSEPSLIWLQLPIEVNNELEKEAMYWPNYFDFSPKHRYQYLKWLENIEADTNKSYAYLYYYGLERQMLLGDYDLAVKETLRLLRFHDIASYQGILMASILRNKFNILDDHLEILTSRMDNPSLFMLAKLGKTITANMAIEFAYYAGFTNKRYIKMHPEAFKKILSKKIREYELEVASILNIENFKKLPKAEVSAFYNITFPDEIQRPEVPQIIESSEFKNIIKTLLLETHNEIKQMKKNKTLI